MRRVSKFRMLGLSLALTGLLLKLAIALFHVPGGPALAGSNERFDQSSNFEIVYCTSHGMMKVPAAPERELPDAPPSNDTNTSCPLCKAVAAIDVAASAPNGTIVLPYTIVRRLAGLGPHSASKYPSPVFVTARGPPIFQA